VFILMLTLGLAILSVGAELLVRSASRLAAAVGLSPLVIGLTVVAFGTSAPELVVSIQSSLAGEDDVATGNVIGSNIMNVLFILGISAVIVPLQVSKQLIRFDLPLMVALSVLLAGMAVNGRIDRLDGILLTAGLVVYLVWSVHKSRSESLTADSQQGSADTADAMRSGARNTAENLVVLVVGLGMLVLGSRWFIDSAVVIARLLGVSEFVIGVTIVAAGTSLPEVATSIMAAIRGERDIAVGNVVGSNLFNIMGVLGISSLVTSDGIRVSESAMQFDLPVMIAVAVACLPVFFTGRVISHWEGGLFLGYYFAYVLSIVMSATAPQSTQMFSGLMLIVIPLTIVTLLISVVASVHSERRATA
jgi:cation:H+ antiporter